MVGVEGDAIADSAVAGRPKGGRETTACHERQPLTSAVNFITHKYISSLIIIIIVDYDVLCAVGSGADGSRG